MALMLSRSWRTLYRFPALLLFPLVIYGAGLLGVQAGAPIIGIVYNDEGLLTAFANDLGVELLSILLGVLFTSGYMYLWKIALRGEAPSVSAFVSGILTYWRPILLWYLTVEILSRFAGHLLLGRPVSWANLSAVGGVVLLLLSFSLGFVVLLIVGRNLGLGRAILASPAMVWQHKSTLLGLMLLALGASLVVSLLQQGAPTAGAIASTLVDPVTQALAAGALMSLATPNSP